MFFELSFCMNARNIIPKHFPKLRPCKIDAFTSNDFPSKNGTRDEPKSWAQGHSGQGTGSSPGAGPSLTEAHAPSGAGRRVILAEAQAQHQAVGQV